MFHIDQTQRHTVIHTDPIFTDPTIPVIILVHQAPMVAVQNLPLIVGLLGAPDNYPHHQLLGVLSHPIRGGIRMSTVLHSALNTLITSHQFD